MIILELLAENFRKYQTLHLANLPERGLIVVAGGNESGKTSIGDAISFVLFGRTDTLTEGRVGTLVCWGAEAANVSLSFRQHNKNYRLTRSTRADGHQTASLWSIDHSETLADNTVDVARQLKELLGYNYAAYIRTFYWSQQTNTDGQADSDSLQAMAGVRAYARLDGQLQQEQHDDQQALEALQAGHQASQLLQADLALDEQRLPDLLEIRETLEDRRLGSVRLAQGINQASQHYPESHGLYHRLRKTSQWIGWLAMLGIGLLLAILLLWGILTLVPALTSGWWPEWAASAELVRGLLWGGVGVAILTSLLLVYGWHLEQNRLQPLRDQSASLGHIVQEGANQLGDKLSPVVGGKLGAYLQQQKLLGGNLSDLDETASELAAQTVLPDYWPDQVRIYAATPDEVTQGAAAVSHQLDRYGGELDGCLQCLNADVGQEHERAGQHATLKQEIASQEMQIGQYQYGLQVKEKAQALVRQASLYSVGRFNQIVHQRCQNLLSGFTQSHYKQLEIGSDFSLHVLSEKKGGYLDFEEISAGTQRQISLAMRVALANSLAESTDAGGQFLYLDEPFAFFDPERTLSTLGSLAETTKGNLQQIWVTVQAVPEGLNAAHVIHSLEGETTLNT